MKTYGIIDKLFDSPMNGLPLDIWKDEYLPIPAEKGWAKPAEQGKPAKQEEVNPMASYSNATVVTADSVEREQREHVRSRLRSIGEELKYDMKRRFGLIDDDAPKTAAELVKRIADGKYTIDKEHVDVDTWNPVSYLRWRDPSVVEDKDGYKAARKQLEAAYEDAKTAAMLRPVADLEKVIDDFKAFKA